jgi:hypothetical protein
VEQLFWIAALAVVCAVTFKLMNQSSHGHDACETEKRAPATLVQIGRSRRKEHR